MEDRERKVSHFLQGFSFFPSKGCCRGVPVPVPLLIIPIIMAHYENVINNTEDIVVAISHMVVGLCSVTILPLASTYVCQRHAAMTSSSSAHLALPTEMHALGEGGSWVFLLASRLSEFFMWHPVGLGTKCQLASGTAHQTTVLLGNGREGGGGGRHSTRRLFAETHKVLMHTYTVGTFSLVLLYSFIQQKCEPNHSELCSRHH